MNTEQLLDQIETTGNARNLEIPDTCLRWQSECGDQCNFSSTTPNLCVSWRAERKRKKLKVDIPFRGAVKGCRSQRELSAFYASIRPPAVSGVVDRKIRFEGRKPEQPIPKGVNGTCTIT